MVLADMAAEAINSCRPGFKGLAAEGHFRFPGVFPAFAPVAGHTCCDQILPRMRSTTVPRNDVIERQVTHLTAAILAGKIVPAQDLSFRQRNTRPGTFNHVA